MVIVDLAVIEGIGPGRLQDAEKILKREPVDPLAASQLINRLRRYFEQTPKPVRERPVVNPPGHPTD